MKNDEKQEEVKESIIESDIKTKKRKNKKKKKHGKHIKTEISAIPPTEEEISERIKGSYLETMNFDSFEPLREIKGIVPCILLLKKGNLYVFKIIIY